MSNTKEIRASVKITPKIKDTFYSFEYSEERSVAENADIKSERNDLWDTCFNEVANQINQTKRDLNIH